MTSEEVKTEPQQQNAESVELKNADAEEVKAEVVDKPSDETDSQQKSTTSANENTTANETATASENTTANDNVDAIPKEEPSAELLSKIKKQIEFYFGDVNMQRDKFLIEQTRLDDGWVPMTVMLNFKALASLSKDIQVILQALESSDLMETSEDKKKIRRRADKPLPQYDDNYRKDQGARTVYVKGFPMNLTMDDLKNYFDKTDSVENIIMRKYKKDKEFFFKGSIFLLFKTADDAKTYVEQESVKYQDKELIKMWVNDYNIAKEKERDERRKKKMQDVLKHDNKSKNEKTSVEQKFKIPKGCVIHISNLQNGITRENIKEVLIELEGSVAYIDYNIGDTEGYIRLDGENSAVEFIKKLDSNLLKVEGHDLPCKLLEGEEEQAYLTKIQENMLNHRSRKGRHNGRKGYNKRRHSPHRDGNAKKQRSNDS